MEERPARHRAREIYIEMCEELGRTLSLPESMDEINLALGAEHTLDTYRDWAKKDHWTKMARFGWDSSEELRRTREMMDIAVEDIFNENATAKAIAESARAYKRMADKIPLTMADLVADEAAAIRDRLFEVVKEMEAGTPGRSAILNIWTALEANAAPPAADISEGTVSYDRIILDRRDLAREPEMAIDALDH